MNYKKLLYENQQSFDVLTEETKNQRYVIFPEDTLYKVDLNSRIISGPSFISVKDEHRAEILYFELDRYHGNIDLSRMNCIIQYKLNNDEEYYYIVPFCDVISPNLNNPNKNEYKMIIPWVVSQIATNYAGKIEYVIRFYKLDDSKIKGKDLDEVLWEDVPFSYSLTTLPATSQILNSLDLHKILDDEGHAGTIGSDTWFLTVAQLMAELADNATTYWTDVTTED